MADYHGRDCFFCFRARNHGRVNVAMNQLSANQPHQPISTVDGKELERYETPISVQSGNIYEVLPPRNAMPLSPNQIKPTAGVHHGLKQREGFSRSPPIQTMPEQCGSISYPASVSTQGTGEEYTSQHRPPPPPPPAKPSLSEVHTYPDTNVGPYCGPEASAPADPSDYRSYDDITIGSPDYDSPSECSS